MDSPLILCSKQTQLEESMINFENKFIEIFYPAE